MQVQGCSISRGVGSDDSLLCSAAVEGVQMHRASRLFRQLAQWRDVSESAV